MTIAIGFVCEDGILLGADSEYTTWGSKFYGEKIFQCNPRPNSRVVLVCAGDRDYMMMAAQKINASLPDGDYKDIISCIENVNASIWKEHVDPFPASCSDKAPIYEMLVGVWVKRKKTKLFRVSRTAVFEVHPFDVLGEGSYFATYLAKIHGRMATDTETAAYVSSYIIQKAKESVPGCGGETRVVTLSNSGHFVVRLPSGFTSAQEYEEYFNGFENFMSILMFSGLDTTVTDSEQEEAWRVLKKIMSAGRNIATRLDKQRKAFDKVRRMLKQG